MNKTITFLHIRKTAGTAIKKALDGKDHPMKMLWHNERLRDVKVGNKVCFFLRDPVDRFVSAWYHRYRKDLPSYPKREWTKLEQPVFRRFDNIQDFGEAMFHGDKQCYAMIRRIYHMRPLSYWMSAKELLQRKNDVFFIGFKESFENDFNMLMQLINLPIDYSDVPKDDVIANIAPVEHREYELHGYARVAIEGYLRKDFEIISAAKEIMHDKFPAHS